jgi:HD-like signal output (HDOD) protein/CheY-like chemotaxis protein
VRVLFVDDEERVLEGLERALMGVIDDDCELVFASSGGAALELLAAEPFDVVVTDMRMPVMDGAVLLQRVHALHPDTVRLILSGQMEAEAALRASTHAHQVLSKPSTAESIYALLRSTNRLRTLMASKVFRCAVGRVDQLPPLPEVYRALRVELDRPEVSLRRVASVIEHDPALVAKLLKIANSAFFAGPRKITSLNDAVTRLGVGVIQGLALATVFDQTDRRLERAGLGHLHDHSLEVAVLARAIAPPAIADVAFTSSLLADTGKLVLGLGVPEDCTAVWERAAAEGRPSHEAERDAWGVDHPAVGAYLLALWGLPEEIVDAVGRHHETVDAAPWSPAAAAVRIATAIVDREPPDERLVASIGAEARLAKATGARDDRR